ncbi:hypothetical protein BJ322DRAFT_295883 [Thelephora terrestris]|uniref:DUF6535 domain-containing protein n=1 Tax=Thelephora terrestris TaxID=56493 RepID=A0A9P6H718_9AGAM|nr:hypothetical protein BJ322DRAFT_295883 [Thelephora terrestris]
MSSKTILRGIKLENPEGEGDRTGYLTEQSYGFATQQEEVMYGSPQPWQDLQDKTEIRGDGTGENQANMQARKKTSPPTRGGERAEFYGVYHEKAVEHDLGFINKYDADLNNTLIFAGLFSAVTSTFITQVQPQLQPDSGDETAALLRLLIYKFDSSTFNGDTPTLPQWTGPPSTIVQVQAILYASLVVSLFAAFLAMVGKQWLSHYALADTRGSSIERSQNRQRKLNGTITWRFGLMMDLLPLMLQGALFLLGCALSLYLWGIDRTIASVVLCVTLLGVLFYLFTVVAGTVSVHCPYQTPHARLFRYIAHHTLPPIPRMLESASISIKNGSKSIEVLKYCIKQYRQQPCAIAFPLYFLVLPALLLYDALLLVVAMFRALRDLAGKAYVWFYGTRKSVPGTDLLDIQCISWILRASVEKKAHLSALKFLATMTGLVDLGPTLISACFDILMGCVTVNDDNGKAVVARGLEELATVSARCCLHALFHMDPRLGTIDRMRRRYTEAFPLVTNFDALSDPDDSLGTIHNIFYSLEPKTGSNDCEVLDDLAHTLARLANEYASGAITNAFGVIFRRRQRPKTPRWILRFALLRLSQDPLPPDSIVINCLSIIAIDLGCSIPLNTMIQDESTRVDEISNLVTHALWDMARRSDPYEIECKRKAITALFPYAVWRERDMKHEMMDAFLTVFLVSNPTTSLWHPIVQFIGTLFKALSPQAIVVTSPHVPWYRVADDESVVTAWAAATLAIQYTEVVDREIIEEVERRVVDALLQIASVDSLRPHVPDDSWSWLNKRPSLPPVCLGRSMATKKHVVRRVGELEDVEILKSYLVLVWSEWDPIGSPKLDPAGSHRCLREMQLVISRNFRGDGMQAHRKDLVDHLVRVLGQLGRGLEDLKEGKPWIDEDDVERAKVQYLKLRDVLLGM